ncbi:MAG: ABC transporter permease, partial [Gemmataceae bacterium]
MMDPTAVVDRANPDLPSGEAPSLWRAWCSLVVLSLRRQARFRQMVWIAVGLLLIACVGVAIHQARGKWGMHHWRWPRGTGPTYLQLATEMQCRYGMMDRSAMGQGLHMAVFGSVRAILDPSARATVIGSDGQPRLGSPLTVSAFENFSQAIVYSLFLAFLLPMWSLGFAIEAFGGDRETQSLIWLLSRPIPRPAIFLAKFVALAPWALLLNVGGFAALCLAAGPAGKLAFRLYWLPVVLATLTFASLFLLIGAYFRRPAIVAILYSFCLEVVLGSMPGYLKR